MDRAQALEARARRRASSRADRDDDCAGIAKHQGLVNLQHRGWASFAGTSGLTASEPCSSALLRSAPPRRPGHLGPVVSLLTSGDRRGHPRSPAPGNSPQGVVAQRNAERNAVIASCMGGPMAGMGQRLKWAESRVALAVAVLLNDLSRSFGRSGRRDAISSSGPYTDFHRFHSHPLSGLLQGRLSR